MTSVKSLFEDEKFSKESLRAGEESTEEAVLPDLAVGPLENRERAGEGVLDDDADEGRG